MTDLPELIANVYRACGQELQNPFLDVESGVVFADDFVVDKGSGEDFVLISPIGLDAFVRDIVPTLKECGWHWNYIGEFLDDQWMVTLQRKDMVHACSGDTPVEACFRAAWEALMPGENP